jgi:hypothetical protein
LDQRKDGYITNAEYEFLFELAKLVKVRKTESTIKASSSNLANVDPRIKTVSSSVEFCDLIRSSVK